MAVPLSLSDCRVLTGKAPLAVAPAPPPGVTTLAELFQSQAARQSDSVFLTCSNAEVDEGIQSVSYSEADAIARRVGSILAELHGGRSLAGAAPRIAIWLEKGTDLILSILATTYSGATWLPLDPDVPAERAATCVADASASLLLCDAAHVARAEEVRVAVGSRRQRPLQLRTFAQLAAAAAARAAALGPSESQTRGSGESTTAAAVAAALFDSAATPAQPSSSSSTFPNAVGSNAGSQHSQHAPAGPLPSDAAYLIYTSGTTGTPKGIAIPHSAALTFSLSERAVLGTSSEDVVWNGFSPAFDMFVEEMWVTVAGGGQLAIGTREECRDVPSLPSVWASRGVTIVNAVPTLIGIMGIAQADDAQSSSLLPPCVRLINLGGEACPPALVKRLARPGLRIINTYGPTETTVTATWDELFPDQPITIGQPLPSYHACLLPISEDGSTVSVDSLDLAEGVEGELAIGGPCVGLGYVGREELTAQKFMDHPLAPGSGEKLYRTGDRVRLDHDMKILFLGRIDTQVKHRGFRIELGEIESLLSGHKDVQAAAVILANAGTDTARLEAFVVARPDAERDEASLHQLAAEHLPAYMRPEAVYYLSADEMPRLPSGKINGKALHDISTRKAAEIKAAKISATADEDLGEETDPLTPLGLLLEKMATVFPQAGRISPQSDFFDDLGGHSLLAAVLVSRLRQATCPEGSCPFASIGMPDIYEGRTPEQIAARFSLSSATSDSDSFECDSDAADGTGAQTGEHLPVSQVRWVLCGLAQILPLLFFFFINSITIFVPYLLFDFLVQNQGVGFAILGAYAVFVVTPVALMLLAVIGKWVVLGRAKEGEYPLYGVYYFRWWLAERFTNLAATKSTADSALYPHFLRAMGAKVGKCCHMGAMAIGAAHDLVEIGDDVVVGADVVLATSVVERGRLILKRVAIRSDAIVGSNSVIEGGAHVGEAAEVAPLTMVPDGMNIPAFQRFHGSPARFERNVQDGQCALGRASRPSGPRALAMALGNTLIIVFVLPLLYFVPQIPGLLLFDLLSLRDIGSWAQVAILSMPIAVAYQILTFTQLVAFRWLFIGRLKEGTYNIYSTWYLRKWFVERLMDLALDVLHPVFASLYIVPFLRLLGVKIARRAEVSTARGLQFELLEIGEESFVADSVLMGDTEVRGNELTLKKTKLEARAFAGNASLLPQGTTLASGTLVGVLSIAPSPEKPLAEGTSCFGSPPVLMPARHRAGGHDDTLLFAPSVGRIAMRLLIEGLRIVMPRAIIIFGLGFTLQICYVLYAKIGAVYTLLLLPAYYLFMIALPSLLFVVILKWLCIGRYGPAEWPLWSLNVWLSEAVTSTWETIAEPFLAGMLVGTPYLAWCFRALGVKIGSRVTLLSSDITEYDCISMGDEAALNQHCGPQSHLFEDRIMKVGPVHIGARACLKPYSIALPHSQISECAQLGSLSLLMKGEDLPAHTAWEGAPVAPRKQRSRRKPGARALTMEALDLVQGKAEKGMSTLTVMSTVVGGLGSASASDIVHLGRLQRSAVSSTAAGSLRAMSKERKGDSERSVSHEKKVQV